MEIDAQRLIDTIREQRNQALDDLSMARAALSQVQDELDTMKEAQT